MRVTKLTTYCGTECHKYAKKAMDAGAAVFGIDQPAEVFAAGVWLVNKFATSLGEGERCELGTRGVYVDAPGCLTKQFLNPTDASEIDVRWTIDGCDPEDAMHPADGPTLPPVPVASNQPIDLDPDNPDGEEVQA